jgi:L-serine dehydratase
MSKLPSDSHPKTTASLELPEVPENADRRAFLMSSAVVGATAVITGRTVSAQQPNRPAAAAAPPKLNTALSPTLEVVKKESKPVMTTIDEFYKVGPGPSS